MPCAPRLLRLSLLFAVVLGPAAARAEPAGPLAARVRVPGPGFVRVRAAALRALGFADDEHLEARHRGRSLPRASSRVADDVVFLLPPGLARDPGPALVRLTRGAPCAPAATPGAASRAAGPLAAGGAAARPGPRLTRFGGPARVFGTLAAAERAVYDPPVTGGDEAPTWFVGALPPGGALDLPDDGLGLPGSLQEWTLRVLLTQPGPARLLLGAAGAEPVPSRAVAGPGPGQWLAFELAAYRPGRRVRLHQRTPLAPPPAQDVSEGRGTAWIDACAQSGPVATLPEAAALYLTDPRDPWQVLPGVPAEARPWAVREGQGATQGAASEGPAPQARPVPYLERDAGDPTRVWIHDADEAPGTRTWVAATARDAAPEPWPAAPDVVARARGAVHLILSTAALLPAAERLAAHRSATGTPSVALEARAVFEAFSDGEATPRALAAFVGALRAAGASAPLRYVLLLGDAERDRGDLSGRETLPAPMARTMYNGATAADARLAEGPEGSLVGAPVVGRLPLSDLGAASAFVERLIAYETTPPRDRSRALLAFLANEARFGPVVDRLIEGFFRSLVARALPPALEVRLTFASAGSPYLWPPREMNDKVLAELNAGSLFYTYVGHGFAQGFDSLHVGRERYPVLHLADAARVDVLGTPPVVLAVACTTAEFDVPGAVGLGEALLARPRGPIAYVGATRVCHPAGNTFLGRSFARAMVRGGLAAGRRLGDVWAAARDEVLDPRADDRVELALLTAGTLAVLPPGTSLERVKREAFWLYNLLGDPGTRLALPDRELLLAAAVEGETLQVSLPPLAAGTQVELTLEVPRGRSHPDRRPVPGLSALDPAAAPAIRENHARANDPVVRRLHVEATGAAATLTLPAAPGERPLADAAYGGSLVLRALALGPEGVAVGAVTLPLSSNDPDGGPAPR